MQTSKNFFVICAIALLVSAPSLPAGESEAQAKAREALRKKMSELDAQEKGAPAPVPTVPTTPPPPAAVSPATTSPAAALAPRGVDDEAAARAREAMRQKLRELDAPQKVARPVAAPAPPSRATPPPARATAPAAVTRPQTPPPVAPAPAPVKAAPSHPTYAPTWQPADNEATARAREAMRQKMNELNAQQPPAPALATPAAPPRATATAPVAPPQTPPPVAPAPAPVNAAPPQPTYAPVRQPADDEAAARARATVRQKMDELDTQQPPAAKAGPVAKRATSEPRLDFKPIAAPPSPISGSKEARLADLLRQYKADEITPEQYHKQRVKILAEP